MKYLEASSKILTPRKVQCGRGYSSGFLSKAKLQPRTSQGWLQWQPGGAGGAARNVVSPTSRVWPDVLNFPHAPPANPVQGWPVPCEEVREVPHPEKTWEKGKGRGVVFGSEW